MIWYFVTFRRQDERKRNRQYKRRKYIENTLQALHSIFSQILDCKLYLL